MIFSEAETDKNTSNFYQMTAGISADGVTNVRSMGNSNTVTIDTGSGYRIIRLDVPSSADITDLAGNPLAGKLYTAGEVYTVNKGYTIFLPSILR